MTMVIICIIAAVAVTIYVWSKKENSLKNKISTTIMIVGILMFVIGATTGTITGYKGANGQYYSDIGAKGSNEWMCVPGIIIAIVGFIRRKK